MHICYVRLSFRGCFLARHTLPCGKCDSHRLLAIVWFIIHLWLPEIFLVQNHTTTMAVIFATAA